MMKDLPDWYSHLEQIASHAASSGVSATASKPTKVLVTGRPGRRPLTETREEIIRRLLDPELTLHEAAALLNLSKATIRRYTTLGKLQCFRTPGGQRRFKLSDVMTFLEAGGA